MSLPSDVTELLNTISVNEDKVLSLSSEIKELFSKKSVALSLSGNVYTPEVYEYEKQINKLFDTKSKIESTLKVQNAKVLTTIKEHHSQQA